MVRESCICRQAPSVHGAATIRYKVLAVLVVAVYVGVVLASERHLNGESPSAGGHSSDGKDQETARSAEVLPKSKCPFTVCLVRGSPQLQRWHLTGTVPSNVVLVSNIHDTLISSGGWMIGSTYLGGPEYRYPRGTPYPGLNVLMYLLSLGPHEEAKPTSGNTAFLTLKPVQEPLPLVFLSPKPKIPLFRPEMLYKHVAAICASGAKQATGDPTATWGVVNEDSVRICTLRTEDVAGEEMLGFLLLWRKRDKANEEGDAAQNHSSLIFFGDSHNRDLEAAIAMASVGGHFVGGFIHLVHENTEKMTPLSNKVSRLAALQGVQKFGIEYGGRFMEALQIAFEVYAEHEVESFANKSSGCGDLSQSTAYQVGTVVGQKVRALMRFYASRWIRNSSTFTVSNFAEPLVPVFFIKCHRVTWRASSGNPPQPGRHFPQSVVSVNFRTDKPVDPSDIGNPIILYRTAVSAASHALVLGLLHPHEAARVAQTALQDLRSQGPITHPFWLPALVDHFYEVRAMLRLLQPPSHLEYLMDSRVQGRVQSLFGEAKSLVRRVQDVAQAPRRDELCVAQWRERLEGIMIYQWELDDFASHFIPFFCKFDLQLTKLRGAGTEEVEYLAFALGVVVAEGLAAAAEAVVPAQDAELQEFIFEIGRVPDNIEKQRCVWGGNPLAANIFTRLYKGLCLELPVFACNILHQRLIEEGRLAELVQVAEWRASGAQKPLRLHTFDLVMLPPLERPGRFAKVHHELEVLLGDAARGGLISMPTISKFPTYVIDKPEETWAEVAEALRFALRCNVLALYKDAFDTDMDPWFGSVVESEGHP